jgi:hypothetical protein
MNNPIDDEKAWREMSREEKLAKLAAVKAAADKAEAEAVAARARFEKLERQRNAEP